MEKIQTKCTSCGQKFSLDSSYIGRKVECGSCKHRFKVEGAAIVDYSERAHLNTQQSRSVGEYAKLETKSDIINPVQNELGFEPANYQVPSHAYHIQPLSLKQGVMISSGIILLILTITIFIIGSRPESMLQDMPNQKRIILSVFIALLGGFLIIKGCRKKITGIILSTLLGGTLITLPFILPSHITPSTLDINVNRDARNFEQLVDEAAEVDPYEDFKKTIDFSSIEYQRSQVTPPVEIKAIVIYDIGEHTDAICEYLQTELQLEIAPPVYTAPVKIAGKDDKTYRISVISFTSSVSNDEVREISKKFANVLSSDERSQDLNIIEAYLDESLFVKTNREVLNNPNHARFFTENHTELYNLSRHYQIQAARRLANIKGSKGRRNDIAIRLSQMIDTKDPERSHEAIRALNQWTLPDYDLDKIVKEYAEKMGNNGRLNGVVLDYLINHKVTNISSILKTQWLLPNGHIIVDEHINQAGSQGEIAIIQALPQANSSAKIKSAANILQRIGSKRAIPAINEAMRRSTTEDKKYLKAAIDEINSGR